MIYGKLKTVTSNLENVHFKKKNLLSIKKFPPHGVLLVTMIKEIHDTKYRK